MCECTQVLCNSSICDIGFILHGVPLDLLVLYPPTPLANIKNITDSTELRVPMVSCGFIHKFGRLERVCLGVCIL